ncbi:MAG: hypothetical protein U9Q37_06570 [Euryarchaeota archaeon]|nr:hypothetical protein [Euryarchaeota archaeon]
MPSLENWTVPDLAAIKFMKEDSPEFQGLEDLKTYLTLLGISSPEAGISIKPAKPADLPIELFNRYMMFERIDTGKKIKETTITEKIKQEKWESDLSSYHFFIGTCLANHKITRISTRFLC